MRGGTKQKAALDRRAHAASISSSRLLSIASTSEATNPQKHGLDPPAAVSGVATTPLTVATAPTNNANLGTGLAAVHGRILIVDLVDEQQSVPVSVSSSRPTGSGASASIWQGRMFDNRNWTVALKVFRPTTSSEPTQDELIQRELQTWRSLRHPRLLQLLGTSTWDSQIVLVSPYMRNGNMLQFLVSNRNVVPLKLVVQVAEGLEHLHTQAGIVHGDLKCQNVLISDHGDALLADFGLSTLVDKLEGDTTTGSVIRWQGTLRFSAPELLGSLSDDDRGRMRSKTTRTDIYALGMLVLQAFTGSSPWGGIPEMEVIKSVLSGSTPPNPGALAKQRGLDDAIWIICLWCWQFESIHRPPVRMIYQALLNHRSRPNQPPGSMISWLESQEFQVQCWNWPVLNGLLTILHSPNVLAALTDSAMESLLCAIIELAKRDGFGLRLALDRFLPMLRANDHYALRLLSRGDNQSLWTTLQSIAFPHAPEELLDIASVLGSFLLRVKQGPGPTVERGGGWGSLDQSIAYFLELDIGGFLVSLSPAHDSEPDLVRRCDESLLVLMDLIARLSMSRWSAVSTHLLEIVRLLPPARSDQYLHRFANVGGVSHDQRIDKPGIDLPQGGTTHPTRVASKPGERQGPLKVSQHLRWSTVFATHARPEENSAGRHLPSVADADESQ